MTSSAPAVPDVQGWQEPTSLWAPPGDDSLGVEAVELAASVGLVLDPWQQLVLKHALSEKAEDRWAAFEICLLVSRQNGKGAILEARELAGLFLFGERLIMHSAHEYKTAAEGFLRIRTLIEDTDWLRRRVKQIRTSHGEEGVELLTGQRLRFIARSGGSGRGFSGDCVILDEAYNLPDPAIEALMPTMSARPNPQLWYTSSAADRDLAPCNHLARVRRRGLRGGDSGLVFAEWAITPHTEFCQPDCTAHDNPDDPKAWAKANPGLGIRISAEHVAREHASMGQVGFARERLGVGNWPTEEGGWEVISEDDWQALADPHSKPIDPVAFSADATPGHSFGAVAVASKRVDGLLHVEVAEHKAGTSWMAPWLIERAQRWQPCAVVIDAGGPAGFLVAPLEAAGIEVLKPTARDATQACGALFEAVTDAKTIRHLDQPALASALSGAQKRPLGEAWAWARKGVSVDISPLVAVTNALWGYSTRAHLFEPAYDALESVF